MKNVNKLDPPAPSRLAGKSKRAVLVLAAFGLGAMLSLASFIGGPSTAQAQVPDDVVRNDFGLPLYLPFPCDSYYGDPCEPVTVGPVPVDPVDDDVVRNDFGLPLYLPFPCDSYYGDPCE